MLNHSLSRSQPAFFPVPQPRFSALSAQQKHHVIYGGTFDPVHQGHVRMVEAVISTLDADRVMVIPTGSPPHKQGRKIVGFRHRLAMVKRAFAGLRQVVFSQVERFKRNNDDYTLSTLRQVFKVKQLGQVGFPIPFVIGADSLNGLAGWGGAKELADNLLFIVFKRDGEPVPKQLDIDGERVHLNVEVVDAKIPDVSSTEIRNRLAKGASAKSLVPGLPQPVADYIDARRLYRERKDSADATFCRRLRSSG